MEIQLLIKQYWVKELKPALKFRVSYPMNLVSFVAYDRRVELFEKFSNKYKNFLFSPLYEVARVLFNAVVDSNDFVDMQRDITSYLKNLSDEIVAILKGYDEEFGKKWG